MMLEGHILNERYQIKRRIGGGGMANVYLAWDMILEREVAVKVLRLEFANDTEFIERFDREAQAASSLSHPNIVNIYDVGEEEHILYMVMEYVDGLTLKEYVAKHGPLNVKEALDIMQQLTKAMSHAHANGLVHRDLKPQNVLIDQHGNVKVTDFGIALALSATALTQTNSILGSVHYLSPEQARGGLATKKSDIYSLGIILYELLTGQLPFSGQSPISIALKHLQNDTPLVRNINSDIPQSVENIVLKATAKDPFHRYNTVGEMEEALVVALEPEYSDVAKYEPPAEVGEETIAIPLITETQLNAAHNDETLIHVPKQTMEYHPEEQQKDNQDVKKKLKKKRKKRSPLKIILIIALIFIVLFVGIITTIALTAPKDVRIPDLVGEEYDDAVAELNKLKLTANKKTIESNEIAEGLVVKTQPAANKTVKENSEIDVYVSEGKEKVEFKNYVGQMIDQVSNQLKDYKEVIIYEVVSDEEVGKIVTQIQPQEDEMVIPSETTVIFEVSNGPKKLILGNLIGSSIDEAKDYANRNGLALTINERHSDSVEAGKIIEQTPSPNSEVDEGSTLTVVVSLGAEELPPKKKKVSFVVPFSIDDDDDNNDNDNNNHSKPKQEQMVQIYIEDMENKITDVYLHDTIKKDKEYTLTLLIEENKSATYKVVRDGQVIFNTSVAYEDGD